MRVDTFPADGEFAGSDPDLAFRQLIMEAGVDIAILEPGAYPARSAGDEPGAMRCARTTGWPTTGWTARTTGTSGGAVPSAWRSRTPEDGRSRDRATGPGIPYMAQILIRAEPRPAWGDPRYDPIWAAATRHDIPVSCHLGRGHDERLPMPPVGFPSYNHDFMVTYSLLAANQVMSLIFDGVFDRFPTLRIVLVEHAFSWILPLMWRMDAIYEARKSWLDIKRKPSEYVKEHIKFTTQPLDYPEDKTELTRAFEWMEATRSCCSPPTTRTGPTTTRAGWSSTCPSMHGRRSCSATASRPTTCPTPCRRSRDRRGSSELTGRSAGGTARPQGRGTTRSTVQRQAAPAGAGA